MSSPLAASSRTNSGGGAGDAPAPSIRNLFSIFSPARSSSSGGGGGSAGGSAAAKRKAEVVEAVDAGSGGGSSGGDGSNSVPDPAKVEAEARLRATVRDKDTISALFHSRFATNPPPPQALNTARFAKELVHVQDHVGTLLAGAPVSAIRMPKVAGNHKTLEQSPGGRRHVIRNPAAPMARISRSVNMTAHIFTVPQAVFIKLQGTSFHLPGAPAATNMAAGAACIKAAACDLDLRFPGRIKMVVAKLEMLGADMGRPNRVDAHGIIVIRGLKEVAEATVAFSECLLARGSMCAAMHPTDRTRVGVELGGETAQPMYEWVQYMFKAAGPHQLHIDRNRTRDTMRTANIPVVGDADDLLFLCHSRRA